MYAKFLRIAGTLLILGRIGLVGLGFGLTATASHGYALSISPASQSVGLGSQVRLAIRVSDVLPGGLGSYDLNFGYDAAILSFNRAEDGFGLGFALGLGQNQLGAGLLSFADTSLESVASLIALQQPDFTLFTVYFDTLRTGTSALLFSQVTLNNALGNPVAHIDGSGSVTVRVAQVAEPGTLGLVGAAALANIALRKRKRRRADPVAAV